MLFYLEPHLNRLVKLRQTWLRKHCTDLTTRFVNNDKWTHQLAFRVWGKRQNGAYYRLFSHCSLGRDGTWRHSRPLPLVKLSYFLLLYAHLLVKGPLEALWMVL